MNTDENDPLTEKIIGCAFRVANGLGPGYIESVYHKAMMHELTKLGLKAESKKPLTAIYDGVVVGEFEPDILVEDEVILELKAIKALDEFFTAKCLNYLTTTGLKRSLLINFDTPRIQIKRISN